MKRKSIFYALALCSVMSVFTACEDMFDLTSSSVQYENNHELDSPADSLYSVVGILAKLQGIADQTILFGELRGDLVDESVNTENDLREIINYNVSPSNKYYSYRDYYSVINNCNYFLSKVDTTVLVSNQPVLLYEYAAVKAIRAWTYLQMTLIYKSVPFITEPILSVADSEKDYPYYTLEDVCDYFIDDLLPYLNTELPNYGEINKIKSETMFFPVRLLLGDMFMWKQDYASAVVCYSSFLYNNQLGTTMGNGIGVGGISTLTGDVTGFTTWMSSDENITVIPMSDSKLHGTTSNLNNIFSATDYNEGKRPISPSYAWKELAESQDYAYKQGTIIRHLSCGDVRAHRDYGKEKWEDGSYSPNRPQEDEWYLVDVESKYLVNSKYSTNYSFPIYTVGNVYLRLAEALNRMGEVEWAFDILKYGVEGIAVVDGVFSGLYIPATDDPTYKGIHARGSGEVALNDEYVLPDYSEFKPSSVEPTQTYYLVNGTYYEASAGVVGDTIVYITTYHSEDEGEYGMYIDDEWRNPDRKKDKESPDTLILNVYPKNYLVEKVEDLIIDEFALETAFEGSRFADLMRIAIRRNDPTYLADKVARRKGDTHPRDEELFNRLSTPDNWFINRD